jgi:cytidine deaminase
LNDSDALVDAARAAREFALAPYSGFKVGAALLTRAGRVITGCNVENASYGLTMCAERVALLKALSEGERDFIELAVVADTEVLTPPCGTCRQIIWEFSKNATIVLANLRGQQGIVSIRELLPRAFDARFLTGLKK